MMIYSIVTAIVVLIWIGLVGLDGVRSCPQPLRTAAISTTVVAALWPVIALLVVMCLMLAFLGPGPRRA